jgi:hypothetical protein
MAAFCARSASDRYEMIDLVRGSSRSCAGLLFTFEKISADAQQTAETPAARITADTAADRENTFFERDDIFIAKRIQQ